MNKVNKKGFTIVELIVSFVLVMIVIIYLLKTVVVAVNKNNDLLTIQDLSVYEKTFLSDLYKDIDAVYYSDSFEGMSANGNTITLIDVSNKQLILDKDHNQITYGDKIYKLPEGISFREVEGKVYNLTSKEDNIPYQVLTIYLKVDSTNEDKDMKILYQNMKMEEEISEAEDVIVTFDSNGGDKPRRQWIIYKKDQLLSSKTIKTPKLEHYKIVGWNTNQDGSGENVNLSTTKAKDGDTYYAKWESTLKNFTYDFNEGNNMNKWNKHFPERFTINYDSSNRMNNVSVAGTSGWENLYIPFNTISGKAYKIKFDYKTLNNYTTLSGYDGIGAQVLYDTPTNTNNIGLSLNTVYLSKTANSNIQTVEIQFTADSSKSYLNFNFGMASDDITTNVQLGNIQLIEQVEIGDIISSTPDPSFYGYTHDGWYDSRTNGTKVNTPIIVDENHLTVYEKNGQNQYTISYNLDGGSYGTSHPTTASYDQSITINNPSKSVTAKFVRGTNASDASISSTADITKAYTFNGWSITNMDGGVHYYGSNISTNTSLSAIKDTTFKNLRGDNGTVNFSATWAAPTITLPKITKTGYTCKWTSDTMEWNSEGSYKPADVAGATSRTFTAVCTANSYSIAFNKNAPSGETISGTMNNLSMTYGTAKNLTANAYTAANFTFLSWNSQANGSGTSYSNGQSVNNLATSGTVNLFAQWGRNTYTLQCYKNGGTGAVGDSSAPNPRICQSGVACAIPKGKYSKSYYTQDGWATSATGNKVYDIDGTYPAVTKSSGDKVNLYAHYTPDNVEIRYSNNGLGDSWTKTKCESNSSGATFNSSSNTCRKTRTYDGSIGTLPKPTRSNYTWVGWYTEPGGGGSRVKSDTIIDDDLTTINKEGNKYYIVIYPLYKQDNPTVDQKYSVVFNKNGGTGTMSKQVISRGVSTKLTANAFTRTGYTFKNWNTNKNGSGTSYSNKQSVTNLAAGGESITLYAQWTANKYTVTYNGNGGTWNGQSTWSDTATYGEDYYIWPNFFTKSNNTFIGWKGNDGLWWSEGTYWTWSYTYDITITAQWEYSSSSGGGSSSCSCSGWSSSGSTTYRTKSDSSCTGTIYSSYSNGCPIQKKVGTGAMSSTGSAEWSCKAILYSRTCN